ncbi:hypothetical protein F2Q69_00035393 [Brassica cretica]|uniref:Uncharacterized protein n=1 Tax=Brassica cretica TaxID=69181 RepID=A0A8S9SMF8_BRACR|nr:hypothetical protein F2Q69_00035393 [Brassica cretica]
MEPARESSAFNWPMVGVALPSICGYIANTLSPYRCFFVFSPGLPFKMSSCTLGSLAGLKKNQNKQRQGDNVFAIYPQIDGKGTTTVGTFKADDSPAGSMLLYCSVQLEQGNNMEPARESSAFNWPTVGVALPSICGARQQHGTSRGHISFKLAKGLPVILWCKSTF